MNFWKPMVAIVLMSPATASAWGPTGHRVIGAIAENHLSRNAQKAVHGILGDESLAMAATWMDEVRSDRAYDYTRDWHWVTIPDGSTYAAAVKNPNGDAVEAIDRMVAALKSDTLSSERKVFCLKVLVHLVGDLHQPLHVGSGDDKGGNSFQVQWFGKGSNLHRVWDSGLIDEEGLSYSELAAALDHVSKAGMDQLVRGSAADWAQENIAYRQQIYPPEKGANLGYAYKYDNWALVEKQLLTGGIRLAGLLNAIYK